MCMNHMHSVHVSLILMPLTIYEDTMYVRTIHVAQKVPLSYTIEQKSSSKIRQKQRQTQFKCKSYYLNEDEKLDKGRHHFVQERDGPWIQLK